MPEVNGYSFPILNELCLDFNTLLTQYKYYKMTSTAVLIGEAANYLPLIYDWNTFK